MSAQLALEATKKAYELRQAANAAGDPNAREEILAKAIDKEVEAESFGKAAKYTRSGAFQGLAAGAGLGVQPGVTLGKLTGAIVGGVVASVGALAAGGVGSVYGAINGPFWSLGGMASQGVRNIVGDFPNWEATPSQKKALEKMVLGAQQTKAPDQKELEQMQDDDGGGNQEDYQQFAKDMTSWIPSMPTMPNKSSMPNMPSMSSIPGLGGQSKGTKSPPAVEKAANAPASNQTQQPKTPVKPQTPSKPQGAAPRATSQPPKSQTLAQKADENAVKKKPRKLQARSTGTTTSQPTQPVVRKPPPKLETRPKSPTANARLAAQGRQ